MSSEDRQIFEDYVNLVAELMNHEADPNIDFLEYANGNDPDESNYYSIKTPFEILTIWKAINLMLHNENISNPVLEKAKNMCSSKAALLQGGIKEFLISEQFIEFCGGVPALNKNWSAENFNLAKAIGIFNALGLNSLIVPKVSYTVYEETSIRIFHVSRGLSFLSIQDESDGLETLDLDLSDEELADFMNDFNLLEERYHGASIDDEIEAVGEFWRDMEDLELLNLKECIETSCCVTIQDDDVICFTRGLEQYLEILSSFDPKTLANYIAISAAIEFECQERLSALYEFLTYFKPALFSVAFEEYLDEKENEKLQTMVDIFKASFEKVKDQFPPNTIEVGSFLFNTDLDLLRECIAEVYNPAKIRAEYEDLQISPNDFFQNMVNIRNHRILDSSRHCHSVMTEDENKLRSLEYLISYIVEHYRKPLAYYFPGSLPTPFWSRIIFFSSYQEGFENRNYKFKIPEDILRSQIAHREDWSSYFNPAQSTDCLEKLTYAYSDYKKWMNENEITVSWQEEILTRFNLDCKKLFFVRFAQVNYYMAAPTISALMNFVDFVTAFELSPESPMNPRRFSLITNNK